MLKKGKFSAGFRKVMAVLLVVFMVLSVSEGWWSRAASEEFSVDLVVPVIDKDSRVELGYVPITVSGVLDRSRKPGQVFYERVAVSVPDHSFFDALGPTRLEFNTGSFGFQIDRTSYTGAMTSIAYSSWDPFTDGSSFLMGLFGANTYAISYFLDRNNRYATIKANTIKNNVCSWTHPSPPAAPEGMRFVGWSYDPDTYSPANDFAPVSQLKANPLSLYAFFDAATEIIFDSNGGSGIGPDSMFPGTDGTDVFPTKAELKKPGFSFVGWGDAVDSYTSGGTVYQPGTTIPSSDPPEDQIYYAQWGEDYTLDYNLNGSAGTPPQSSTAVTGPDGTVQVTAAPSNGITRTGYKFEGWSTSQGSATADIAPGSTFSISGDTTLYAVWSRVDYKVSFDLNGAVNNPAPVIGDATGHHGDALSLPNPALVKDYYVFKGWCADQGGTGTAYPGGGSLTIGDSTPQNLTLYAKWDDADKYTLSFDKNGDDVGGTPPSGGTYYNDGLNDTVTLPASNLTKTGYTFAGWTKIKGSNTVDYADSATFQITENMTLYPVWTAGTFTLDYDFNGEGDAVSDAVPGSVQGGPGSPVTAAPQGGMYRPYYRFTGWNTAAKGTGAAYAPGTPVLLDHTITLYAQWEALTPVHITYHTNCSDALIQAPTDTTDYYADGLNEDGNVTSVVLNRFGYNFKGWNTKNDGTGTSYAAGADIKVTENTDLYAVWEEGTYTLSYDKNKTGVTGELPDNVTGKLDSIIRTGSGDNLKLKHHHFKEWNTASDGTGIGYQPGDKVSLGADTTLYAIWEKNNYEITYSLNADDAKGTVPSKDSGAYDETFTAPSLDGISRPKYKPIGWNDDPEGNGKDYTPGTSYHFDDTKTLYVKWEAVPPYEVHYFKNASDATGTPPEDNNTYCEDGVTPTSVTVLDQNDLKRLGYEFAGWNTKENGTGLTYQPGDDFIIKTHMNLYAQWKVGTYTLSFDKGHSAVTGSGPAAVKSRSDKDITLPKEGGFKRKDFGFTGWNTKANGSGTFYKAGIKLKILEDTTIYAQWKRLVNVSFDNSEGALKGDTNLQVTEGTKLGDVKLPSVNSGYTVKEWIINGQKVTDYKNYVVDENSDIVLVLEKKKDPAPAPKPTPGGDTNPDKPDKDSPNGGNGGSSGGSSNNGGNGNSSGGNGSGGSSGSNNNSGNNSQSDGSSGYTSGGTANSVISGQIGSGRSFEPGKPISGNTDTAGQNNTGSSTESTGELTTIQEEQVPLSSGSGIFGQSEKTGKSGSAYGSIWECIVHWLVLLGMLVNTLYAFLRGRHIRKKRLLGSGFFADTLLPMLAVPLCVLAFEFQKCALDIYFILAWALLAMGTLYHINRQFQKNADEVEQELGQ